MRPFELAENRSDRWRSGNDTGIVGHTHRNTDKCGDNYTDKHSATNLENHQYRCKDETDYRKDGGRLRERSEGYRCSLAAYNDARRFETDKRDIKTDTSTDSTFQTKRNRIHDQFTYISDCQKDKQDTFEEDRCQCHLPCVSHTETDCKHEEGVETHARSKSERFLRINGHYQTADDGRESCSRKDGVGRHTLGSQSAEDARVHRKYVCHRKEGCYTRNNLGPDAMLRRIQPESLLYQ